MLDFLIILLSAVAALLRKLWQRLTGRVPVPVRVRRFALPGADILSRPLPQFPVERPLRFTPGHIGYGQR